MRWGRTQCLERRGIRALYYERAAGSPFNQRGGISDLLCLLEIPEYGEYYKDGVQGHLPVAGTEFETRGDDPLAAVLSANLPCVVCHAIARSSAFVKPAAQSCPEDWTTEYRGYLMSGNIKGHRESTLCIDEYPEGVCGEEEGGDGAVLYHMVAGKDGLEIPVHHRNREISCVVYTK